MKWEPRGVARGGGENKSQEKPQHGPNMLVSRNKGSGCRGHYKVSGSLVPLEILLQDIHEIYSRTCRVEAGPRQLAFYRLRLWL